MAKRVGVVCFIFLSYILSFPSSGFHFVIVMGSGIPLQELGLEIRSSHINLAFAGVSLVWLDGVYTGSFELSMRFYFSTLLAWVFFYFDRAMADLLVFRGCLLSFVSCVFDNTPRFIRTSVLEFFVQI